jgi:hypothetical protein
MKRTILALALCVVGGWSNSIYATEPAAVQGSPFTYDTYDNGLSLTHQYYECGPGSVSSSPLADSTCCLAQIETTTFPPGEAGAHQATFTCHGSGGRVWNCTVKWHYSTDSYYQTWKVVGMNVPCNAVPGPGQVVVQCGQRIPDTVWGSTTGAIIDQACTPPTWTNEDPDCFQAFQNFMAQLQNGNVVALPGQYCNCS